jgi:hypothetical protein
MRGKSFLSDQACIDDVEYTHPLATPQGITARDRWDCQRSNVVLMNLIGADKVSIGSMIEIGWADAARIPLVLAMEPGNLHEHAMIKVIPGFILSTLTEAINVTLALLEE